MMRGARMRMVALLAGWIVLMMAVPAVAGDAVQQAWECFMSPDFCGKTLPNCEATVSENMRLEIKKQVQAGMGLDEIKSYWVNLYGQRILSAPPKQGFFWVAWLAPAAAMVAGAAVLAAALRRRGRPALALAGDAPGEEENYYRERVEEEIKRYL